MNGVVKFRIACRCVLQAAYKFLRQSHKAASCRYWISLAATALLSACASTTPGGRAQLVAPDSISVLHSSLDNSFSPAALHDTATPCSVIQCDADRRFQRQVEKLGEHLAKAAYEAYPELKERSLNFHFVVAETTEPGSSSDAAGTIVIYRGVCRPVIDEKTLAYLLANEMGHVIAKHHGEKTAATIVSSLLTQILFAPAGLARGIAVLTSMTATTVGKNLLLSGIEPQQQKEADVIALTLLAKQGLSKADIADSLQRYSGRLGNGPWEILVARSAEQFSNETVQELFALAPS